MSEKTYLQMAAWRAPAAGPRQVAALSMAAVLFAGAAAFGQGEERAGLENLDVSDPAQVLELAEQPRPGLSVEVQRAVDGGWDFGLTLANFSNVQPDEGEAPAAARIGHVHLFVDGAFVSRFDGAAAHLDPLTDAVHEIAIAPITQDGRFMAGDGELIVKRFVILEPRSVPSENAAVAIIDVPVAAGRAAETVRVERGEFVVLRWSVDAPMELHLHGYDVEVEIEPAAPATMLFFAEFAGRFAVDAHLDGGAEREVLFLEVLPSFMQGPREFWRRGPPLSGVVLILLWLFVWFSPPAAAHGLGQRYDLPLPLRFWVVGAGATVVLSFAAMGLFFRDRAGVGEYPRFNLLRLPPVRWLANGAVVGLIRVVSVAVFLVALYAGLNGTQVAGGNVLVVLVWVIWWVGFAFVCALAGNLWALVNPIRTLFVWAEAVFARLAGGRSLSRNWP